MISGNNLIKSKKLRTTPDYKYTICDYIWDITLNERFWLRKKFHTPEIFIVQQFSLTDKSFQFAKDTLAKLSYNVKIKEL